jgi:hypothetical protein
MTPRAGRLRAVDRRRRFSVENLEGRQMMAADFTSAFGIGGQLVSIQKVALDSQGNRYAVGSFLGTVSFDPNSTGGNVLNSGNTVNAFVAKYSPTNTLIFVKQFADDESVPGGMAIGSGIAVDNNTGAIYVTGSFSGKVDFDPGGNTVNLTSVGGTDGFVVKLTANGDLDSGLAKRFGGTNTDQPFNLALDKTGANLVIAGNFIGTANFDPGGTNTTLTSTNPAQSDGFVLKLSSTLGFGFAARGGVANSSGSDAAVDSQGNVYLVGTQTAGTGNAYVDKFNAVGTLATQKLYGGPVSGGTFAVASAVVIDSSDNVYISGTFVGTGVNFNKFNGPGTVALDSAGNSDAYLIKIDPAATLVFARRFGSINGDFDADLGIDANNNIYQTGFITADATFGTTGQGTPVLTHGGPANQLHAYILKVDSSGNFIQAVGATGSGKSVPRGIAVNALGQVAIVGDYTAAANFGTMTLQALGSQQVFVATMSNTTTTGNGNGNGNGNNNGNNNGNGNGNNNGGGMTAPPMFVGEMRIVTGRGRRKIITFQLNFSSALDPATAQNVSHYMVTQMGRRRSVNAVPVLSATLGAGNTSVTLTLGGFKKNKPLQLMATGLTGPGGTAVAPIITNL